MEEVETIRACPISPWEERLLAVVENTATQHRDDNWAVRIAVSSSARNGMVGIGSVTELYTAPHAHPRDDLDSSSSTLGTNEEQNLYSGELAAIRNALDTLLELQFRKIMVITRNRAVALALRKPRQQSSQKYIRRIYKAVSPEKIGKYRHRPVATIE